MPAAAPELAPELIRWDAGPPYRIAFSTRLGGVSDREFASLNLGLKTADAPARVLENRRRLFAALALDGDNAAMARQVHGATVRRAEARGVLSPTVHAAGDGLWSDEPGRAMLLLTADCLPIALWRSAGPSALAVLHAGWRGLLAGIVRSGAEALAESRLAAVVGPGIGGCCYEVGDEIAAAFRDRFGHGIATRGRLDLRKAAERALREAGCESVGHVERCTACEPDVFFSHRRDGGRTGRQGVLASL